MTGPVAEFDQIIRTVNSWNTINVKSARFLHSDSVSNLDACTP
jgi:hypothetical protein